MTEQTEWTFAAEVAKWMSLHLQGRRNLPFVDAKVETKTAGSLKRRDLTLYDRDGNKVLTGEIRFPDAVDGQTPYNATIVTDARRKARAAKSPFFFTWNVNRLVLWKTDAEHEVRPPYDVVRVRRGADLAYPSVERIIREEFIPKFLEEYAAIFRGDEATGALPLDRRFIGRLESTLDNLANAVFMETFSHYQNNQAFKKSLDKWMKDQEWLLADDEQLTRDNLDRATRLACYISANKLVFYQGLRRNRKFRLEKLAIPKQITSAERLRDHFNGLFEQAKIVTRDYQTIFDGGFIDRVPFIADLAVDRWRALVSLLDEFDFRQFGQDVIGHIFEDLLSPEERHRWGQHYTQPVVVDVINAFCIRNPKAVVLDPSSGSGTFLVRAYARKRHLARGALQHADLLAQLYACEISEYASHLTSLNLATRDLIDGENFPRVARADFFDTQSGRIFCSVPDTSKDVGTEATKDIHLNRVDAIVGNPPYLRQEEIGKPNKKSYTELVKDEWPGLKLSGRSDLHIYFWPHSCKLLDDGGYFGFLTSSSWLDVEYGFHLQRWILQHFELVAVLESTCEPWFTGARVATCVTILRRCSDPVKRFKNLVRFVQLRKPLKEILANDGTEAGRQEASEKLRGLIESTEQDHRTADYRILVVPGLPWPWNGRFLRLPDSPQTCARPKSSRPFPRGC
jgi:type I restriction-modification system DNA methylase subunit